jgi:signal peptidase II
MLHPRSFVSALLTIASIIIADQISKWVILEYVMQDGARIIPVTPFFNIVLVFNKGVSFGMFQAGSSAGTIALVVLSLVIALGLFWWLLETQTMFLRLTLALIIGGAIGNMIDRIAIGAVVDFLDFHWGAAHFPAFNIADTAISIGAILLLAESLGIFKPKSPHSTDDQDRPHT